MLNPQDISKATAELIRQSARDDKEIPENDPAGLCGVISIAEAAA